MQEKKRPSWDEMFMEMALVASRRSPDPSTQVGAVVTLNNRVQGTGYNAFPPGCEVSESTPFKWVKGNKDPLKNRSAYVAHAERNALDFCFNDVSGGTIYTTWYPCNTCSISIVNRGIKKVVYYQRRNKWQFIAARKILVHAGVLVHQLGNEVTIEDLWSVHLDVQSYFDFIIPLVRKKHATITMYKNIEVLNFEIISQTQEQMDLVIDYVSKINYDIVIAINGDICG
jgi:dCMP deaminase